MSEENNNSQVVNTQQTNGSSDSQQNNNSMQNQQQNKVIDFNNLRGSCYSQYKEKWFAKSFTTEFKKNN